MNKTDANQFNIRLEHLQREEADLLKELEPVLLRRMVYEAVGKDRPYDDAERIKTRLHSIEEERQAIVAYSPFMLNLFQQYQPQTVNDHA